MHNKKWLDKFAIMNLIYDKIIQECSDKWLKTLNKKIMKLFKTNNFPIDKFLKYGDVPIPIPKIEEDYQISKFCYKFTIIPLRRI